MKLPPDQQLRVVPGTPSQVIAGDEQLVNKLKRYIADPAKAAKRDAYRAKLKEITKGSR